jgi:hypothetical protein
VRRRAHLSKGGKCDASANENPERESRNSEACSRARAARSTREKASGSFSESRHSITAKSGRGGARGTGGSRRWVTSETSSPERTIATGNGSEQVDAGVGLRAGWVPARGSHIVTKTSEDESVVRTRVGVRSTGLAQPRAATAATPPERRSGCDAECQRRERLKSGG